MIKKAGVIFAFILAVAVIQQTAVIASDSGKTVPARVLTASQRAAAVTTDSSELDLNVKDMVQIKAILTPASSTDVVRFYSTNKKVAVVGEKTGRVTALSAGTATIKVYAKAAKTTSNGSKSNKTAAVTVNVGTYIDKVQQVSATQVKAIFKADIKNYTYKESDFAIKNNKTKAAVAVKSVLFSGKEAIITTYADMADGNAYTVSCGTISGQFTATDGKISTITVVPEAVPLKTMTPIYALAKDENGVIVKKCLYGDDANNSVLDFTITAANGSVSSEGLYLNSLTATAKVSVTYQCGNSNQTETITSGAVMIGTIPKNTVSQSGVSYSISDSIVNFSSLNYVQDNTVPANTTGYRAYFKIVDRFGTEISDYGTYIVTSSDPSVLAVNNPLSADTNYVNVAGIKTGSVNLLVKNRNTGVVVAALPVTVIDNWNA